MQPWDQIMGENVTRSNQMQMKKGAISHSCGLGSLEESELPPNYKPLEHKAVKLLIMGQELGP